jgi:hypothetical protein
MHLAILGEVFDVSAATKFYAKAGSPRPTPRRPAAARGQPPPAPHPPRTPDPCGRRCSMQRRKRACPRATVPLPAAAGRRLRLLHREGRQQSVCHGGVQGGPHWCAGGLHRAGPLLPVCSPWQRPGAPAAAAHLCRAPPQQQQRAVLCSPSWSMLHADDTAGLGPEQCLGLVEWRSFYRRVAQQRRHMKRLRSRSPLPADRPGWLGAWLSAVG